MGRSYTGVSGYNVPRCLGVLPHVPLHGVPTYHRLVIVALLAGQAGGCHSKALHAAEANELRFYAGSLLRLPALHHRPPAAHLHRRRAAGARPAGRPGQPGHCRAPHLPGPAPDSAEQWEKTRAQLQEELREFTALMRYLPATGPAELLAQVERRLLDLQDGLTKRQC
jgi:hypothetical protein